jgi:hypothetical protein
MILGAPASRRRVAGDGLINTPAGCRRSQKKMTAGQTVTRWMAANFQEMTFIFEMGNLSANENE